MYMKQLWYKQPAALWEEALPLGNGRLGAMVYGGVDTDTLQINDVTLWSGSPTEEADRPDAYQYLDEIRRLVRKKAFAEAQELISAHFMGIKDDTYYGSYTTMGDISVKMEYQAASDVLEASDAGVGYTAYRRALSLDDAAASVTYSVGGVQYQREHFISAPSQVFVSRYQADQSQSLHMMVSYARPYTVMHTEPSNADTFTGKSMDLVAEGKAGEHGDMRFSVRIRVIAYGQNASFAKVGLGEEHAEPSITVRDADEVVIYVTAATDYVPDAAKHYKEGDPKAMARAAMDAVPSSYAALKAAHIADYKALFDRVTLDISGLSRDDLPIDARLIAMSDPKAACDIGLVTLYYQFGRYLLICSSRRDNPLPANLQGIWNREMMAPWNADYHSNINIQMNYWPAGPANLIDCMEPLCRYIEGLVENGRKTARRYYNSNGWMSGMNNNVFGYTSPGTSGPWGQFSVAGAWLCTHLYEYYAFTQRRDILERIYPTIRENVVFSMNTLIEDEDGYLVTSPSASPENAYCTEDGHSGWVCEGATMDLQILHETFREILLLGELRGRERDAEFLAQVEKTDRRLRPLRIGAAGQLQEWSGDWDCLAPELNHRHVSHLFGLHPGTMITPEDTPDLIAAAKKTLAMRGDDGTGWSLAWKINFQARLGDGDHAWRHIKRILRYAGGTEGTFNYQSGGGTYANLFDAHPPFQIDGNFGAAAGICEMLLQSHRLYQDRIHVLYLLPALPTVFADGTVRGLCARGAFTVSIVWKNRTLDRAEIVSQAGQRCAVRGRYTVLCGGTPIETEEADGLTLFATEEGGTYLLYPADRNL